MKKRIDSYTYGKYKHTDIIPDEYYVYCWGFNIKRLLVHNPADPAG